jgi:hypothetical protein
MQPAPPLNNPSSKTHQLAAGPQELQAVAQQLKLPLRQHQRRQHARHRPAAKGEREEGQPGAGGMAAQQ